MTELVIQIENTTLLPSLRKVITSLRGVKDAVLAKKQPAISPVAVRLINDLATFQNYKRGWDGENASPLSAKTAKHFMQLLSKSTEDDLQDWNIFPEKNGTLILENDKQDAQINLADNEFSYFKDNDGAIQGESNIKYSVSALLKTIRNINK